MGHLGFEVLFAIVTADGTGTTSAGSCYNMPLRLARVSATLRFLAFLVRCRNGSQFVEGFRLRNLRTTHAVSCNMAELDCSSPHMWYSPGYVSPRSGCCHCEASCANTSGNCTYYDALEDPQDSSAPKNRRHLHKILNRIASRWMDESSNC